MARYYRYQTRKRPPPQITISILESNYEDLLKHRASRDQPIYDIFNKVLSESITSQVLKVENEKLRDIIGRDFDIKQELKLRVEELEKEVSKHRQAILRLQSMPRISSICL